MITTFYIMLILILIDIVAGNVRAMIIDKNWKSRVFRVGLYKKASEIAIVVISFLLDEYCLSLIDRSLNLYLITSVYIVVMETMSILENFSDDKDLMKLITTIKKILLKFKKDVGGDDGGEG